MKYEGRVILLVGPSCAGKSTLAVAIQAMSERPVLAQSLDGLFAAVPERWGGQGDLAREGFHYLFPSVNAGQPPVRRIGYGPAGWALLQGFHRSVAAYAAAGVDVVVDDMLLDEAVLADWATALADIPTLLVSVTAPMPELLRREAARQRRSTPGLVAGHHALHAAVRADLNIDTAASTPEQAARRVLDAADTPGPRRLAEYRVG